VHAVDCWTKEKPLSASSDRTVRVWKVAEETHLVFRGHKGNIDCAQYLTDTSFVSAGQDGALSLWKDAQKHPVRSVAAAHGLQSSAAGANWISSLAALRMSNVVATGSCDGFVRLWSASAEDRQLEALCEVAMPGCVNSLALTPRLLVAGCGKEHKYGRWWSLKGNLNKIRVVRWDALHEGSDSGSSGDSQDQDSDEDDSDSNSEGDSAEGSEEGESESGSGGNSSGSD
jgi:ribosomal RNA-processing protein 9